MKSALVTAGFIFVGIYVAGIIWMWATDYSEEKLVK